METKLKKWPDKSKFKWQKTVVLTREEGTSFDALIRKFGCSNASQLCKKIATQELELIPRKETE